MAQSSLDTDTRGQAAYAVPVQRRGDAPRPSPAVSQLEDFPGCDSFHLPASEIGHCEGLNANAHAQGRMEVVAAALRTQGIEVTSDLTEDPEFFRGLSGEALIAAALACTGEADFRRKVQEQRSLHTGLPPTPGPEE